MKAINRYLRFILCITLLSAISTTFMVRCFANNYTQMSLPNGAKTRLGKGHITDILYSPDGNTISN